MLAKPCVDHVVIKSQPPNLCVAYHQDKSSQELSHALSHYGIPHSQDTQLHRGRSLKWIPSSYHVNSALSVSVCLSFANSLSACAAADVVLLVKMVTKNKVFNHNLHPSIWRDLCTVSHLYLDVSPLLCHSPQLVKHCYFFIWLPHFRIGCCRV